MASPAYKLSIGVNIDPAGAKSGGAAAQAAVAAIGTEAQTTATKLQQLINSSVGLNTGAANQNVREWTGALAAQGKAVDDLRAKYNPLFAVIREYKSSLTEIRTLTAQGILTTDEMTAAISRQRQATLASIDAIKGRNSALSQGGGHGFAATNVMYQAQDIGVTAAMGMSPAMIGLQQGSQIAGAYAGMSLKEAAATTGAAIAGLASPVAIAAIGFTTVAAAAIQFGVGLASSKKETETLDTALERHQQTLKRLEERYGALAAAAKGYANESSKILAFQAGTDIRALRSTTKTAGDDFFSGVGTLTRGGYQVQSDWTGPGFAPFADAITRLRNEAKAGKPDFEAFYNSLYRTAALNPEYAKKADELAKLVQQYREGSLALQEMERVQRRLFDAIGPNGTLLSQGTINRDDAGNLALFQSRERIAAERSRRSLDADLFGLDARSPQERAEAARRSEAARYDDVETSAARRQRIEQAGILAQTQAERQLKEAQDDRARSLDTTLKSRELELSLIGRTISETERLRMEQELISQLEAEAAKNHTTVDPKEIAAIKEKAAAYGQLSEQIAAANLFRDQGQQLDRIKAEISLVGASDEARRRGIATLEAEQQLVSRGIGLNTSYAESYRANAVAISDMTNQLRKQNEAWDKVQGSAENTIDSIIDGLASGDIDDALADIAKDISSTFLELAVKNPAKNALLGTDYGTISDVGGLGGIFSRLFGGEDATAIPGLGKSVGSMSVNAGTVMINGGVAGLGGLGSSGTGGGILSKIFGANDNSSASSSSMAAYRQAIKDIESSGGNYDALGPLTAKGDRAYGAYQVMGGNIPSWTKEALGRRLTPNEFLADHSAQDSVFDRFFGKSLNKYGNPQDAASVWFTGRPQGRAGNAADILGTTSTKYVEKFNAALGKLDTTAVGATQNLGTFGSGIGQFGQNLASAFPPAPTGGGGNWLSNLFGGLFGSFTPIGAQATLASNGGIGLYDRGGWTGAGAVDEPAGVVHRGEIVWSQKDIARNGGPETVEAMRLGKRGYLSGGMVGGGVGAGGQAGGQPIFQIINQTSTPISGQVEESQDESGRRNYRLTMSDEIGNAAEQKGGGFRRTMSRQYGLRSAGIAR
ncbi:phage tail length tape measure family protein [Rhizobium johnstonii]|uniref:phage tail length tape measure family protein n=1 Tax=Rhizobium johnstonii TaxID=3019933 RepID=UPI003F9E9705